MAAVESNHPEALAATADWAVMVAADAAAGWEAAGWEAAGWEAGWGWAAGWADLDCTH
jgi:hypothetical protein